MHKLTSLASSDIERESLSLPLLPKSPPLVSHDQVRHTPNGEKADINAGRFATTSIFTTTIRRTHRHGGGACVPLFPAPHGPRSVALSPSCTGTRPHPHNAGNNICICTHPRAPINFIFFSTPAHPSTHARTHTLSYTRRANTRTHTLCTYAFTPHTHAHTGQEAGAIFRVPQYSGDCHSLILLILILLLAPFRLLLLLLRLTK